MKLCSRCKAREVETIGGWESWQCRQCNDRDIERNANRAEWDHFHPGEPCPPSELNKER